MKALVCITSEVVGALLRLFPLPVKTGLTAIGNPDRNSPVLVTCNYHLTVIRVKRALRGTDCYLLIANSRGINVWCAAAGGLLANHDIISVLKTSEIESLVDHRTVLLPQMAAAGVEAGVVQKKTGWKVIWGPVYARDIQRFLKNGMKKEPEMREVEFALPQRLEMAAAWAFPTSLILSLIASLLWPRSVYPLIILVWGLALLMYVLFPVYDRWLRLEGKKVLGVFDFERGGIHLTLWLISILAFLIYGASCETLSWGFMFRWALISLFVVFVLCIDFMGSTPVYKSGLHEDRLFRVVVDEEKCKGAALCEQVCPRNCYAIDRKRHLAIMPRAADCVQCGACIIQCPFDALTFRSAGGETIGPETLRKFKLNLMGHRAVKPRSEPEAGR